MTTGGGEPLDEALLAELRSAVQRAGPVPDSVLEAARAAFTLRDLDAELAQLVSDSRDDRLVGVRGGSDLRLVRWAGDDVTVEVQLRSERGRRSVVGQVVGPAVRSLRVEAGSRSVAVDVDELGRFDAQVPAGPVRLRLLLPTRTVVTSWVLA